MGGGGAIQCALKNPKYFPQHIYCAARLLAAQPISRPRHAPQGTIGVPQPTQKVGWLTLAGRPEQNHEMNRY